jgi:hypothetical protein
MIYICQMLSMLLAIYGSLRASGSFYSILISCGIITVVQLASRSLTHRFITNDTKVSAFILALFQALAFLAHHLKHGFSSQELLYVLNVPLLYLVGSYWALSVSHKESQDVSTGLLHFLPFSYATGAIFGSVSSMGVLRNTSAANLRSHELLFSVGVLIGLLGVLGLPPVRKYMQPCLLLTGLLIFISALQFRGFVAFISGGLFLAFCMAQFIQSLASRINEIARYIFVVSLVFMGVVAAAMLDVNTLVFKWTLYSLVSDEPLNGRLALWRDSLSSLRRASFFGDVDKTPIDAHNFILNTISHSGILPSLLAVAAILYALLALIYSQRRPEKKWHIAVLLIIIFGSMIQPVQFADGIAYQLSFFAVGALSASSFANQLDCPT